jgi:hypothetical protein
MTKLYLTRYLYIYDEVVTSFIISLLNKQSIDECYFWISELFLSGFETESWDLIWFIYYDFYYINNSQFISFINKKHNNGQGTIKDLLTIVKNLFKFPFSSQVFITRQYNVSIKEITHIFRGKKPGWLVSSIPTRFHVLFRYINKQMYHFAVSSLPKIDDELFDSIQIYFELGETQLDDIKTKFYNTYNNDFHKIWSIICLLIFNPKYINSKKNIYLGLSDNEYEYIFKKHSQYNSLNSSEQIDPSNILFHKCLYQINSLSSSFHLSRDMENEINNCYYYHWEYYAYNSPIWKNRFNKYDITVNDITKQIIFNDSYEQDDFYEQYGYEPDEQTYNVQNKIFCKLPNNNWNSFFKELFPEELPIYQFQNNFKFIY